MLNFVLRIVVSSVAVLACAYLLPGIDVAGFLPAIFVALALTLLNQFVKPLLILLTLPATILTLGLFLLVINAVIILLADWIVVGFEVKNFLWALLFSVLLSVTNAVLLQVFGLKAEKMRSQED
jgi:putative membrane protein